MKAETKGKVALFNVIWEHVSLVTQILDTLHMSTNTHESAVSTDLRLQIHVSEQVNLQI